VGALVAARKGGARPWLLAGAVSDAVDAVVISAALRGGRLKGVVATATAPGAALAAGLGAVAALRLRRR
jgi:hypothetical protein